MKRICDPEELRKALEVANLMQHIQNIQGENQKQLDGSFLPVCEPIIKFGIDAVAALAVQGVWDQQCARDWKTVLQIQIVKNTALDADLKSDNLTDQFKDLNNADFNAQWDLLTPVQKDRILKRLFKFYIRRQL